MKRPENFSIPNYTPPEFWPVILSYLPVKTVVRFRSVSKSWKSIIEDQNFSSVHLKYCSNNRLNPYLIFSLNGQWVLRCIKTNRQEADIPFATGGETKTWWNVCGGVDGLILLLQNNYVQKLDDNVLLWNPSIRKSIYLPTNTSTPADLLFRNYLCLHLCLLFDASTDDYKVVMVHYHFINSRPTCSPLVDVFSLKSRSWRKVVDSGGASTDSRMRLLDDSTCVGPCAHWIGQDFSEESHLLKIISFDITSNKFLYTPLPKDANDDVSLQRKICVLDGCAMGLLTLSRCHLTIWTMEISSSRSETSQFWTQKYQIRSEDLDLVWRGVFCFCIQKRDILVLEDRIALVLSDLETGNRELVGQVYNYLSIPNYVGPYVESLLLSEFDALLGVAKSSRLVLLES